MSNTHSCKALILGQSGAGKSTVLNAAYNSDVSREKLYGPAPVGNTGRGVTSKMANYFTPDGKVLTDTVGFDDSRFDPEELAMALRSILRGSRIGFTHIVLVLPLGRVTAATRIYLANLEKIFGKSHQNNLLLYVNRCDDGSTLEDFESINSTDSDLGPLCQALQPNERILTGSLMSHRNPERDRKHFEDRLEALGKIQKFLDTSFDELDPPAVDHAEMIYDFVLYVMRTVFKLQNDLGRAVNSMGSTCIEIQNYYPLCPICSSCEYTDENGAMRLVCGHIAHTDCLLQLDRAVSCFSCQIQCPTCGKEGPMGEQLPLYCGGIAQERMSEQPSRHRPSEAGSSTHEQSGIISKFRVPPRRKTFGQKIMVLYHLTAAGEEIKESGEMLRGGRGLVGGGIYFAETVQKCRDKAETTGYIVEAKVLVGRAKQVELGTLKLGVLLNQYTFTSLQAEEYDSLHVLGLRTGDEFIVYNKDQVELISVKHDNTGLPMNASSSPSSSS